MSAFSDPRIDHITELGVLLDAHFLEGHRLHRERSTIFRDIARIAKTHNERTYFWHSAAYEAFEARDRMLLIEIANEAFFVPMGEYETGTIRILLHHYLANP